MFGKLFGRKPEVAVNALPIVRNVTLGRTVWLDTLAWRRLGSDLNFPLDRDTLQITAQGIVDLKEGGFVHRFYTDDHAMFQVVSDDREGNSVNDVTVFAPWSSAYPGSRSERSQWGERLRAKTFSAPALPTYERLWFGPEAERQEPVTFWEEVHDDRDGVADRRIFQTCMLFARDLTGEGRELLLAVEQGDEDNEISFEIMLGVALGVGEFKA